MAPGTTILNAARPDGESPFPRSAITEALSRWRLPCVHRGKIETRAAETGCFMQFIPLKQHAGCNRHPRTFATTEATMLLEIAACSLGARRGDSEKPPISPREYRFRANPRFNQEHARWRLGIALTARDIMPLRPMKYAAADMATDLSLGNAAPIGMFGSDGKNPVAAPGASASAENDRSVARSLWRVQLRCAPTTRHARRQERARPKPPGAPRSVGVGPRRTTRPPRARRVGNHV